MALESILGGLVGLGGSVAPAVLDFFNKKHERKHIEQMRQIEMEAVKAGHQFQLEQTEITAGQTETSALYAHDQSLSEGGGKAITAMRASVRPVLTYIFFAMFVVVKMTAMYNAWWVQNVPVAPALIALWDENTAALFAAIMGFWFGQRAIMRFGYGPSTPSPKLVAKPTNTRLSK